MQKMMKNKGITLVSLVVTIVILLILAGVTLNIALSDNGIFNMAKKATKEYQIASEREYIEQNVLSVQLDKYVDDVSSEKLGKSLVDRNLDNSSIWDIIVEKSTNKTYGTGWNYLVKGTELQEYGKTQYNWVVNYETGEIIQLEDESYDNFDYKSTIAVDNPLFNLDSANVGLDKANWGNNATLYYYDNTQYDTVEKRQAAWQEQKGKNVTNFDGYDRQKSQNIDEYIDNATGAFNFNGNNYIEINNSNGFDFTEGLTFEFYGKVTGYLPATESTTGWANCLGMLGIWNGEYSKHADTRFVYSNVTKELTYRLFDIGDTTKVYGEWGSSTGDPWNQRRDIGDIFNKDIYFIITFGNKSEDKITQTVYVYLDDHLDKPEIKYTGWYMRDMYEKFVETAQNLHYIELGRCTYGGSPGPNWSYMKGLCYSTRIYNRALTEGEIKANVDTTTKFHEYIINNKK